MGKAEIITAMEGSSMFHMLSKATTPMRRAYIIRRMSIMITTVAMEKRHAKPIFWARGTCCRRFNMQSGKHITVVIQRRSAPESMEQRETVLAKSDIMFRAH